MKKFSLGCLVLTCLMVAVPVQAAGKDSVLKIGIVDTQKIAREARAAKDAQADFAKEVDSRRTILSTKQNDINALEAQLKSADQGEDSKKLKADIAKEKRELTKLRSSIDEELKKISGELNQKIREEIRDTIRELSKKEGFTFIMEKNAVAAVSDSIDDITDKVIKLYDAKKK